MLRRKNGRFFNGNFSMWTKSSEKWRISWENGKNLRFRRLNIPPSCTTPQQPILNNVLHDSRAGFPNTSTSSLKKMIYKNFFNSFFGILEWKYLTDLMNCFVKIVNDLIELFRLRLKVVDLVGYFASPPQEGYSNFKRAVSCFRDLVRHFKNIKSFTFS